MENPLEYAARRNELDWAVRNKSKLTPAQRAKYRRMWEEMNSSAPPASATAEVSFGPEASPLSTAEVTFGSRDTSPADLDPVEAAAAPIAPDPLVRPKPARRSPAMATGTAAFQAVLEDVGGDYDEAIRVLASEHMQNGIDPERAMRAARARAEQHQSLSRDPNIFYEEMGTPLPTTRQPKAPQVGASQPVPFGAMPDADPRTTRAERLAGVDATAAKWDRQKAAYDRATGLGAPDAVEDFVPPAAGGNRLPARSGPYDLAGRPGYDRTFTPQELAAQRGDDESPAPASFTLPGPRTLDGKPVRPPRALATQEDAARYKERGTDPETGRRTKSQYDLDMEARGYTAVMEPDGSVGYRTTYAPATDEPTGLGAIGRAGRRVDLEKSKVPGTEDSRYEPRPMMTPTGETVQVWAPTDAGRAYTTQQAEQRTKNRLADRAGLGAEADAMTADQLRSAVRAKRTSEKQDRESAWRAQMMLGGGRPTGGPGGTKAATNALMMLPPEWQNAVLAKGLRPDLDGTTPLTVDANSAKNAMRLMSADIVGQGLMGDTRAQMMQQQQRQQAFAFAEQEARKMGLMGYWNPTMTRQEAERLRRRVEAMHPGMGGVVDALPITEEGEEPASGPSIPTAPPGASGAPVPPMPSGRRGPPRPGSGSRYPNT